MSQIDQMKMTDLITQAVINAKLRRNQASIFKLPEFT